MNFAAGGQADDAVREVDHVPDRSKWIYARAPDAEREGGTEGGGDDAQ